MMLRLECGLVVSSEVAVISVGEGNSYGHLHDDILAILKDAKEGSIISIMVDKDATNEKLKENTDRMNRLFKD